MSNRHQINNNFYPPPKIMSDQEVEFLKNQLSVARNEINNLRQQVRNLTHVHKKDCDDLKQKISAFRCEGCMQHEENAQNRNSEIEVERFGPNYVHLKPIGVIRSPFSEKRAVPRQSSVAATLKGCIELTPELFTNPEHSLEGLSEFSHIWIIYLFHKNTSHPKAKVAPPRLSGERVGVFSTRSPHRPCPIGLSLVEIERIENAVIHFYGTDMVDGTPVLDIKPYIPHYDTPTEVVDRDNLSLTDSVDFYNSRQEPDGEESDLESIGGASGVSSKQISKNHKPATVKVPNWVMTNHPLTVLFNDKAESQIAELKIDKHNITDVLQTDPRSVYLRTKHASQIFTFQLSSVTVTCKFDDRHGTVTVVQVRRTENVQDECLDTN